MTGLTTTQILTLASLFGRFQQQSDGSVAPRSVLEVGGIAVGTGSGEVPLPVNPIAQSAGVGTDHSANPPSTLTQLASGTVTHAGQLYVQNQSAATLQLWLQGATVPILIAPGGANSQGGDWQAAVNMPWFTGTYTINGATGSQFFANSN